MEVTIRPIVEAEADAFRSVLSRGFGGDRDEEDSTRFLGTVDPARTAAAFEGDRLVGTCATFPFELTVPGGTLPMGGTTMVTVQATHRRRGLLRAMMRAHLDDVRACGEPLAGLWASESSIYGRFGYGPAAEGLETRVDGQTVEFVDAAPPGVVHLVERGEARALLPAVYERARPQRAGMVSRTEAWWRTRILHDDKSRRKGYSAHRYAVYTGEDGPEGYAIYRQKDEWDQFPEGEINVLELFTTTSAAHSAMWRYLTRIDLFPNVRFWNLPADDELPWRITKPRRVQRKIWDSLWLRVMDVPRSLEGRTYADDGRIVLGIHDAFLPDNDGRYELRVEGGAARCRPSADEPDLVMPVEGLGAIYLGGHRATTLARAGVLRGDAGALATADRLFASTPLPWCPEDF